MSQSNLRFHVHVFMYIDLVDVDKKGIVLGKLLVRFLAESHIKRLIPLSSCSIKTGSRGKQLAWLCPNLTTKNNIKT